jgi:hypothetical protein
MTSLRVLVSVLALLALSWGKSIYDHKTSYVAQLTTINFKDQVTKIRQNTNYVAVVQFYKASGTPPPTQTANPPTS